MNYETYKTLTKKQKEEYDFKFKGFLNNVIKSFSNMLLLFILYAGSVGLFFISVVAYSVLPDLENQREVIIETFVSIAPVFNIFNIFVAAILLIFILSMVTYTIKYVKFLHKHKIKMRGKVLDWWRKKRDTN
jgi:hypothetical protein